MAIKSIGSAGAAGVSQSSPTDEVASAPPPPRPEAEGSKVEAYQGPAAPSESKGQQLRKGLGSAVADIARKNPEPFGTVGNVTIKEAQYEPLFKALQTEQNRALLGEMSEAELETAMADLVQKSWPHLSEQEKHELAGKLSQKVREHVKYDAAFKMRDAAVGTMNDAADSLEKLSKDPKQLEQLKQQLSGPATNQTEKLRAQLGIDDPSRMDPLDVNEMGRRIDARAHLVRGEAKKLEQAGPERIFMVCADHNVADAFMERAGIQPGSVAARQVDAAREQGKSDKQSLEYMKLACSVGAAMATGGLGVGAVAGTAASVTMAAPGLYEKYEAIGSAKAGESAGTKKVGAAEDAKHNRNVAVGFVVAEPLAGTALSHAVGEVVGHFLPGAAEAIAHGVVTYGAHDLEHALSKGDK